jgi:PAS domain S-box-containing protein
MLPLNLTVGALTGPESQLRAIIDRVPTQIWSGRSDGTVDFLNRRWLDYTGLSAEQALGRGWTGAVHQDDHTRLLECMGSIVESGTSHETEMRLGRVDGEYRWFLFQGHPLDDGNGAIVGWCGTNTDIDDRKRAEGLLRASEEQFRAIVDSIPALIAVVNASSGEIELVNRAVLDYFGRTLEELQDWPISDSVHPDDLPRVVAAFQSAVDTGEPPAWEHRLRRSDGVYRWFHLRGFRWHDSQNRLTRWYCVITDIHDRKIAEDALRRSERFLLEVQGLSRTGGWRLDLATGMVESSPELQRAYQAQPGEDISNPEFFLSRIHPDDQARVRTLFERSVQEKIEYRADCRIIRADGSVGYQHAVGRPVPNEAGEVVEFIGAAMDMTDHWVAATELERASQTLRDMQTKLSRAAQVATVGELAASIAHEVNQPLASVVANGHACVRWLSHSPPNIAKALEAAERIVRDGKDAGEVVRRIRTLFKRTTAERVPVDIGDVIRDVVRFIEADATRRRVEVVATLEPRVPAVLGDRVQLQQLVLNLMLNALDAVDPNVDRSKRVVVRTRRGDTARVVVEIEDNGIGLDDPHAVFEPFYTTKTDGMGMGLAICRSIVTAHDGTLAVTRNDDFGTTFWFALPIENGASQ